MIDESVVQEYLGLIGRSELDEKQFEVVTLQSNDKNRFTQIENKKIT